MLARLLYSTKWFVMLIALQVLVFNHIHIAGYATPLPCVYFLLILPSDTPRSALLMWGFALGFIVDTFTNTPGMAAAALTFIGFIRPALLHFFSPRDKEDNAYLPSAATSSWPYCSTKAFSSVSKLSPCITGKNYL